MLEGYCEKHHVVPKCIDSSLIKDKNNIVKLTAREHFVCHQLLCEIYPGFKGLRYAMRMMCMIYKKKSLYKISSRLYERWRLSNTHYRSILQYDIEGIFIKEWSSIVEALKFFGIKEGIRKCCITKIALCCGYQWKYKDDDSKIITKYIKPFHPNPNRKCVLQYDLMGKFIREWESAAQASKAMNRCSVDACCRGACRTAGGYQWKYKSDKKKITKFKTWYKSVIQMDLNNNVIKEWKNKFQVKKELGIEIYKCIIGKGQTAGGFKWKNK